MFGAAAGFGQKGCVEIGVMGDQGQFSGEGEEFPQTLFGSERRIEITGGQPRQRFHQVGQGLIALHKTGEGIDYASPLHLDGADFQNVVGGTVESRGFQVEGDEFIQGCEKAHVTFLLVQPRRSRFDSVIVVISECSEIYLFSAGPTPREGLIALLTAPYLALLRAALRRSSSS